MLVYSGVAFSVTDCGPLESPENGAVTITQSGTLTPNGEGAVATYTCNLGYHRIASSDVRTCQTNGVWSGVMATCVCKYCQLMFVTM